jgi:hypothetical protein
MLRPRSVDTAFLVLVTIIGLLMPLCMHAFSFMYLVVLYYPFAVTLPFPLLVFAPRRSFLTHCVPLTACVIASSVEAVVLYRDDGLTPFSIGHLSIFVLIPVGAFLVSYLFFWLTLPLRRRSASGGPIVAKSSSSVSPVHGQDAGCFSPPPESESQ